MADESNLFVSCAVDDLKYTIEGGCEPGIALFCRNEFFPELDTSNATLLIFEEICDCINFLCSSLPSGEGTSDSLILLQQAIYIVFSVISSIVLLIYLVTVADLCGSCLLEDCKLHETSHVSHLILCRDLQGVHHLFDECSLLLLLYYFSCLSDLFDSTARHHESSEC